MHILIISDREGESLSCLANLNWYKSEASRPEQLSAFPSTLLERTNSFSYHEALLSIHTLPGVSVLT